MRLCEYKITDILLHVPVAQWIERNVADVEVGGSNPSGHTNVNEHSEFYSDGYPQGTHRL